MLAQEEPEELMEPLLLWVADAEKEELGQALWLCDTEVVKELEKQAEPVWLREGLKDPE